LFPRYLGEFSSNPNLPQCIEQGEAPPQKGFSVPYGWDDPKPYLSKRGLKKGRNLLDFELSVARCRTPKKLGGWGAWGSLLGIVIAKKFTPIFPGKNLFSAREKSVKIWHDYCKLDKLAFTMPLRGFLIKLDSQDRYHEQHEQHQACFR